MGICTLGLLPFLFKTLREILFLAWAGHVMEIVVAKEVVALEDMIVEHFERRFISLLLHSALFKFHFMCCSQELVVIPE